MRILVAGDTHGDLVHCRYLLKVAKRSDCSVVFVVGDFGYWAHRRSGVEFLDGVNEAAEAAGIPVYFLDGNHDKTSHLLEHYDRPECADPQGFLRVRDHLLYARRGHRWTWSDVSFIALGGAYSVDKQWRLGQEALMGREAFESLWFPEEEMSDQDLEAIFSHDASPVDVILAHDMPRGSVPTPGDPGAWEENSDCVPNQDRMREAVNVLDPRLFIHGHLHIDYTYGLMHSHRGPMRDMHVTTVVGLHCNQRDAPLVNRRTQRRYDKTQSWMVLDASTVHEEYSRV